ncbi:MAG: very short patch repair endonuclease [Clostridia bacterium]|nr:very short patch repair endonuclease [Clostridia bacterium]
MDNRTKAQRSKNMAKIPSQNTKPEIAVGKFLFKAGFRYRKNVRKLPGKPDFVLRKYKTVIFVNGCFWHGHEGCKYFVMAKSNTEFWMEKINYNKNRDRGNILKLTELGWNVIVVWECELRHGDKDKRLQELVEEIQGNVS